MAWPDRARRAALALSTGEEREDDSLTVVLLRDIHAYFASNDHDRVRTADLLAYLHAIEDSPWGDWYGKTLSAHGLSRLLKPYRIKTLPVWVDGETVRGYKAEQFDDAFARALGVRSVRNVRSESASQNEPNAPNAPNAYPLEGPDDADPDADIDFGDNDPDADIDLDAPRSFPLLGDPGYVDALEAAHTNGHVTDQEAHELYELNKLVTARRKPAA